jgi:hypothetical protein
MNRYTDKELRRLLALHMKSEKGKPVSDLDRAYKRGWRDCIRSLRAHLKAHREKSQ